MDEICIFYDVCEVMVRIVDGSWFHEFKVCYGMILVIVWVHIYGYLVGIIVNNGIFFSESVFKVIYFIEVCGHCGIFLVFFQNIIGFMVGKEYE